MNSDLDRLRQAASNYTSTPAQIYRRRPGHWKPDDTFVGIAYVVLTELRKMSPQMLDAMAQTPWPEDMSARDQMQAMLNAVIDSVLERVEPNPNPNSLW